MFMMTKHYTELTGAKGDRIQFGAPQYDADTFFLNAAPIVRVGGGAFSLKMIGPLGFTLASHETIPFEGDLTGGVEAIFEQEGAQIARAMIVPPTSPVDGVIDCRFFDRTLDLEKLSHDNAAAVTTTRVWQPKLSRVEVPTEYKVFCADMLDTMATYRHQIEKEITPFEASLTAAEMDGLLREMEEGVDQSWRSVLLRANALVLPFKYDEKTRTRMKRYTENVVTPEMCKGALQHRCFHKPMGYPGDFEIMNAFYDHVPKGADTYARLVDLLGLMAGRPVSARMHRVTEELERLTASMPDQQHFHVMSVGAGPAREFKRYFENGSGEGKGFSITLVDPEEKALECAIKNIYSSIRTGISSVMVAGMNTSFTEMLRPQSTFRHLPPQDFIYSAGLTDYLNPKLTRSLIKKLYEKVKPGGSVLIGNVTDAADGMYWSAEYAVDWTMYFRNKAEMEAIAEDMPGEVSLGTDPTGSYYMLTLTKPA